MLKETGCLFVTTAVESVDDRVLAILEKGHTREDFFQVVRLFDEVGLSLAPTFVAFTPWITLDGYLDLLSVIAGLGLIRSVAPVQLTIRLLIPPGSRLLELPEVRALVGTLDEAALVYPWSNPGPKVDRLHMQVRALVQQGATRYPMPLHIGDAAPHFTAETTEGTIRFHDWIGDGWVVLFSHPKDFTPVCTTELGYMAKIKPELTSAE